MASAPTSTHVSKVGSAQSRIVLQFLLCLTFIVFLTAISGVNAIPTLVACALSFLLLLNIPYNLRLLELALDRLARGLPVEPISLRHRWPLKRLFSLVATLSRQTGQQAQIELRNVAYRDQLLQQVSKTAAQEERNRLARDLHDTIKQQIFSIVVSAAAVKARWEHNPSSALKVVDDIERTAQEAQVEMQALLQQLRPGALENIGLIESLRVQCQALGYRTAAEVSAELEDLPPDQLLPIGAQEMIFRIVQEGFANIARHARATHVWLSLKKQRDALLVEIGDDGQGFDLAQAHELPNTYGGMGLTNVRERVNVLGGTLTIWSLPHKGTTLHLCIPLARPEEELQQQERATQLLTASVRKTNRVLRAGAIAADIAAALLLLYIPDVAGQWLVFLCLIAAFASWLWAQQYRLQIALDFGQSSPQNLFLLARSYALLAGVLLLAMLYPSYFGSFRIATGVSNNVWFVLGYYAAFVTAILLAYARFARYTSHYYASLPRLALHAQIRCQFQQIVVDWTAWTIILGITIFQWNTFPSQWLNADVQSIGFTVLITWFLVNSLKSLRAARWHRVLRKLTETAQVRKAGAL